MIVHHFHPQDDPARYRAVRSARFESYCVTNRYEPEDNHPDRLYADDAWDAGSTVYMVEGYGHQALATCRLLGPEQRPFPCEMFCVATSPLPDSPLCEVSRIISGKPRATLLMLRAVVSECLSRGYQGTVGAVDRRFLRMLIRAGLPFQQLGPEKDYHGLRFLVGFSNSDLPCDSAWREEARAKATPTIKNLLADGDVRRRYILSQRSNPFVAMMFKGLSEDEYIKAFERRMEAT